MTPLRHPLVAFASVNLVLACTCGPPTGEHDEQATDPHSGEAADTADTDGAGATPPPCPDYTGYADGAWYRYVYTESWRDTVGYDGGYLLEVEQGDGGTVVLRTTSWAYDPPVESAWSVAEGWCDEAGWWLTHERQEIDVGQAELLYYEFDYPEGCLRWPASVSLGDTIRVACESTRYTNEAPEGDDWPVDVVIEVVEAGEVDTPAGRFEALGVSWTGGEVDQWRNEDLGFVADRSVYVLEDWGP